MIQRDAVEADVARLENVLSRYDLAALLHVDFHDPARRAQFVQATSASEADVELLKTAQRLARVVPLTDPVARAAGHEPHRAVAHLMVGGLTSAHQIAEIPESVFVSEHADAFGGGQRLAREAHRRAVQVRAAVRHAAANVRDIASPYFRAIHGGVVDSALTDYVEGISGYQELFGGLNYLACEECASIFGPAAYFFDLMRITDRYITKESPIPPNYHLRERRPDLFELPLTCENTNNPVPYVVLVNDAVKRHLGAGTARKLATAVYPFNLPYNEPLTQLTGALARLGTPLVTAAAALLAEDPERLVLDSIQLATAALGVSPELVRFLITRHDDDAIAADYGLTRLADHFPAGGPGSITVQAKGTTASGAAGKLGDILKVGQQFGLTIDGKLHIRTVTKILNAATVEVDVPWSDAATDSLYTIYPLQDLTTVQMFRDRAGIAAYDDLVALLGQRLSAEERVTIGDSLWINATGESLPGLHVSPDTGGDAANPVWRIAGLSARRLDRLSRLRRLSRATGVPADVLDWLIVQSRPNPSFDHIDHEVLIRLASLQRLAEAVRLPLVNAAAFAYPLKAIGRESASALADPFDEIFNAASARRGADPYAQGSPIPFDPARPLAWRFAAGSGLIATGTVVAASATTVTLDGSGSDEDGAYVGLTVTITRGTGEGQRAVVKAYDGTARLATLYTAWSTVPDTSSTWEVAALPDIAGRLSAALRVPLADLQLLGAHVGGESAVILLTLENLTALWRLATLAAWTGLTTDAFLTLVRVLRLPAVPPSPADGLAQLETIVQVSAWLARTRLTVYELDYVLHGTRSRYLRLGYDPASLLAAVTAMADNGSSTLLTAQTLAQAGFSPEDAERLVSGLRDKGFLDGRGVARPAHDRFATASKRFPVKTSRFTQGHINGDQARAAVAELRDQHPPFLTEVDADTSILAWDYTPGAALAGLFTGIEETDAKRAIVSGILDDTARRISFAELAGLVPVRDQSFVSADIGPVQSRTVYGRLLAHDPPILEQTPVDGVAELNADYSAQTELPALFESPATGQLADVTSYAGASRVVTIHPAWTVVPDPFCIYQVRYVLTRGKARGGTATTIQLDDSASAADGAYAGYEVRVANDLGHSELRRVTGYVGSTRTATVAPAWDTAPANNDGYQIEQVVTSGSARGGTSDTITLAESALPDDHAYDGCLVELVADADAARKVAEVRISLASTATRIGTLCDVLAQARAAQTGYATQALASLLAMPPSRLGLLLPLATGRFTLDDDLPGLLTPPAGGTVPAGIADLADRLTRAGLAGGRAGLDDDALSGVARRPDHFGLDGLGAFTLGSLRLLSAIPVFVRQVGTDTASLVSYLDTWISIVHDFGKRDALSRMAGWEPEQLFVITRYLSPPQVDWATLPGLLRLQVPFAAIGALSADAAFLARVAEAAWLPSLGAGIRDDDTIWAQYLTTASAALDLLSARFGAAAPAITDELTRDLAVATRDALLGYAIVVLGKKVDGIRTEADLFDYLLIDLQTAGCDTTSPIAQGITSVQLYMQRVRLGLEPGASAAKIRETWWDWISTYRAWEANRRVFVYPENYIDPSLRRGASPQFAALIDGLLQGRPTDEHVARAVTDYFDAFEDVASLTHVGAYKLEDDVREGGQIDQYSYLVGRTNTTPYLYYVRTFTRSLLPDAKQAGAAAVGESFVWAPWRKVEATIDSPDVTPVLAFDRLFLFWNEIEPTKSSHVSTKDGNVSTATESSWTATLRYTFRNSAGTWISSQELEEPLAIRAMPNPYQPASNALVARAYENTQAYWSRPYAQQIPRGLPAAGTLSFDSGSKIAQGTSTALDRQVTARDSIWVGGETRLVVKVTAASQQLEVDPPFTVTGKDAPFKVIPRDDHLASFPAFTGPGGILFTQGSREVTGVAGTRFTRDFTAGDEIAAGGETRIVVAISGAASLTVDRDWSISNSKPGDGEIMIQSFTPHVSGQGTHFTTDVKVGDVLFANGEQRTVTEIKGNESLWVDRVFTVPNPPGYDRVKYTIIFGNPGYTGIPRTRGDERLMVFYGPNLDVRSELPKPADDWRRDNLGDDPFIANLNQFNAGLYAALTLATAIKNLPGTMAGDVTGQPTLLLGQALDQQTVRLFAQAAQPNVTNATPPMRAALDRENDVLFVRAEDRPLIALYWGNSTPGATQNQSMIGQPGDRALAYHPGRGSSLYGYGNQIGWYLLNAAGQSFWIARDDAKARTVAPSTFVRPFPQPSAASDMLVQFGPYTTGAAPLADAKYRFTRLTTSVVPALQARLLGGGFDLLLSLDSQSLPEPPFSRFYQVPGGAPPPAVDAKHLPLDRMDFNGAYGPYFWEIFFHTPLLVAGLLTSNQSFAEAKRWYEYIYNPQAQPSAADDGQAPYWRFRPFRDGMTLPGLRDILQNQFEITAYNDDPFNPDAIARLRISAYAKATVLKYVDNLILWGDALFRQDTRESLAQATNLYILASQLLGRRPEIVGTLPPRAPQSFDEIAGHYSDDIPQFLIELENSSLVPASGESHRYADAPINDINAYFCVPENSELTGYWDRIEDRLYKIRHCLTIDGVERALALFAPPIDVRSVVAAYGAAGAAGGVTGLAAGPIPALRFSQLIAYAKSITEDVIRLGSSLLSALERKDAEALATLQVTQEGRVLDLTSTIRRQQLDLAGQQRQTIQAARDSAAYRSDYYQDLISAGYNTAEAAQIAYLVAGLAAQGVSTIVKTASAIGFALPQAGSPFAMTYGGQQVGHNLQEASAALDSFALTMTLGAEVLGLSGQYARRSEDWELQKRLADFDVSQFDAQLVANATDQAIAQNELSLAQREAQQNAAVGDFYRTKFTSEALYAWLANRLSTTYFQTYTLALDLARMAQRALQYELRTDVAFVNAGAWDDLRRGLTAGESLMLALDQLESAYVTGTTRNFEITKTISLASIDPVAFLQFIRTGEATFSFDEALFDADFPGHFMRRIKTLSVSIPALVGPYQNVRATLTQTANRVLLQPDLKAVRFLLGEDVSVDANKIEHNVRAHQSITITLGQGDSGLFVVDLDDPLLLPFEQTGAVSNWQLSMPPSSNPIDLSTVADVIFELRYTALDGGAGFRADVAGLPQLHRRKWSSTTQAAQQDADAWHLFMTGPVAGERQTLFLRLAGLALPNVTQPRVAGFFLRLVVPEGTTTTSRRPYLTLALGEGQPFVFSPGAQGSVLVAFDTPIPVGNGFLPVSISFNLTQGYTPAALVKDERLSAAVLQDIELVLFLAGDV